MALEIERKFLPRSDAWRSAATQSTLFRQGYLTTPPGASDPAGVKSSVRVRVEGGRGLLNIKSARLGVQRHEYEYEIPLAEANEMLDTLCVGGIVEKTRHLVPCTVPGNGAGRALVWEVDEFHGANEGLIVAEIELDSADQTFELPEWVGAEVSDDPRYYNVALAATPYAAWPRHAVATEWDERTY